MNSGIVVTAPAFNSLSQYGSGWGSDLSYDTIIVNFSGINDQINQTMSDFDSWLNSLNPGSLSSLLNSLAAEAGRTPPPGYHFGAMDPVGDHYMIKDGDPKNSLVATPWYAEQVHKNADAMNKSLAEVGLADAALGLIPAAQAFSTVTGLILGALGLGFAYSEPIHSPVLP